MESTFLFRVPSIPNKRKGSYSSVSNREPLPAPEPVESRLSFPPELSSLDIKGSTFYDVYEDMSPFQTSTIASCTRSSSPSMPCHPHHSGPSPSSNTSSCPPPSSSSVSHGLVTRTRNGSIGLLPSIRLPLLLAFYSLLVLHLPYHVQAQYKPQWPDPILAREVFVLNLEDGYFGCQVNDSADFLQLFELSKLCDDVPQCFRGSDELMVQLKCTDRNQCHPKMNKCTNGVCLDNQCYCNDGFGGKGCDLPDENECKYRPCDVFSHCTNTMGSFYCSCFPGYDGDGFTCHDINECEEPALAALCAENAECCNLPGHFVCKCKPGYTGNATESCADIDECLDPDTCGRGAVCQNIPGSYACSCPEGFSGDPYSECYDIDECQANPCGDGALCMNLPGGYECSCPSGFHGNPDPKDGCKDIDECIIPTDKPLCGVDASCINTPGGYLCQCPVGFTGNPRVACVDIDECPHGCGANTVCLNSPGSYSCSCKEGFLGDPFLSGGCIDANECLRPDACGHKADCYNTIGSYQCLCPAGYSGDPYSGCLDVNECEAHPCGPNALCSNLPGSYRCECPSKYLARGTPEIACDRAAVDVPCGGHHECTLNAVCSEGACQCKTGYQANGIDCIDVDECKTKNICGSHSKCYNSEGSYECECKAGFEKMEDSPTSKCRDINECLFGKYPCGVNTICDNNEGSFSCSCGIGFIGDPYSGCRSPCDGVTCGKHSFCQVHEGLQAACMCDQGFTFDPNNITAGCIDINECDGSHGPSGLCGQGALCTNVPGSHHCFCPAGFTGDPFRYCEDIDECSRRYGPYGQCGNGAVCTNTLGSFSCVCRGGFTGNPRENCTDIDECHESFGPNGRCGYSAICTNTPGSFSCRCPPGSAGDPFTQCVAEHMCDMDDACAGNGICSNGKCICPSPNVGEDCKHPCEQLFCGEHAKCALDESGTPSCICAPGYVGKSNSLPGCIDVDECTISDKTCGPHAVCRNTPGSFECMCPHGFLGDPYAGCDPEAKEQILLDGCGPESPCPLNEECSSNGHTNQCVCRRGYVRDKDGVQCRDTNECTELTASPCGMNSFCTNLDGGFVCTCPAGFTGNPYTVCYPDVMRCVKNSECPGNTLCIDDPHDNKHCGCESPYIREGDYCIVMSRNCSTNVPCPPNQDCIFTGAGYGFCICPKGFTLDANGHCRDIDECKEMTDFDLCSHNSECVNLPGSFECVCSPGFTGNSRDSCTRMHNSCGVDIQCPSNERCLGNRCECLPPFIKDGTTCKHPCDWKQCGQNTECVLTEVGAECQCKPGCTGNPSVGCNDINECTSLLPVDPNGPCGASAVCINVLGSYKCECPSRSEGDPYTSGCFDPSKCIRNSDCPSDTTCDVTAGQCTDACSQSQCGPNTECIARNHKGDCVCKSGFLGDPNEPIHGCKSPCDGVWCTSGAVCIVNSLGQGTCQCTQGLSGNPWSGGSCFPEPECSSSSPCANGRTCINSTCVDQCDNIRCGVGARCDPQSNRCSCLPFYIGDPDVLCVPPYPTAPVCNPGCGTNSHCTYSNPNKCICNQGYTGNPYKSCSLVPKCDSTQCGANAICLEGTSSVECVCPAGYHGNPYLGCEDMNECLQGNPCGTGANCINVIGSYQCVCPSGLIGNPLYACQPPRASDREGWACAISETCPRGLICYRGSCTKRDTCSDDSSCTPENSCAFVNTESGHQCVDPCDTTVCGPNAACRVIQHLATCECAANYTGNAADVETGCIPSVPQPLTCTDDSACDAGTICKATINGYKTCIDPCLDLTCGPNADCRLLDKRGQCKCHQENMDGNPYDLTHGCFSPVCVHDTDCSRDEVCAPISQRKDYMLRECQNVCRGFKCGNNALCVGLNHSPTCECRSNFKGDAYDGRSGCQPDVPTCVDDSSCPETEACRWRENGLRNCSNVCEGVKCGPNAHCLGRSHLSTCECLPGFIGDAGTGCQKPPQHLCEKDNECTADKKCHLTQDGIRDCVDVCFNARCPTGSTCFGQHHEPFCQCLPGYSRLLNDTEGKCGHNSCANNYDCKDHEVCSLSTISGLLDCVSACDGLQCGSNAHCTSTDHQPMCQCKTGFEGNAGDISTGCRPKDHCSTDNDCLETEMCRIDNRGVKVCLEGCTLSPCGPNTKCSITNHFTVCSCLDGFTGQPDNKQVGCHEIPAGGKVCTGHDQCVIVNKDNLEGQCVMDSTCNPSEICEGSRCLIGCRRDSDCTYDKACFNSKCTNPCSVQSPCGSNTECQPVVHRPRCSCLAGFTGNPFDFCSEIPAIPPPECTSDGNCILGSICELDKCIPGCRFDDNCPHDKACINRQCLSPCDFPNACGNNAVCNPLNHRPRCTCSPGFSGDADISCTQVIAPVCFHDSDCSKGSICESGKCIDACRTDDSCPFNTACINRRCQDPCSVFGACGRNSLCRSEEHKAICNCPAQTKGDANVVCERVEVVQLEQCATDGQCPFGDICESGTCVEGCRNDEQCSPEKTCFNSQCLNPCTFPTSCGSNTDCVANSHRPVCTCKSGFVGDTAVECKPIKEVIECNLDTDCGDHTICDLNRCIIGCRGNGGCPVEQSCINRLCQNPCGFFGVCGRNAECTAANHTAMCSCPTNYRGNPNTVCTEAPPECLKDTDCLIGHVCENNQCVIGCRHDNNCPTDDACINGQCENPCSLANACGPNAKCTPYQHRPRCECPANHYGNPYARCEPMPDDYCDSDSNCGLGKICDTNRCTQGCRTEAHCPFEDSCINKICQNPCNIYGACGTNALCKSVNHDRQCSCLPEFTGDPKTLCERIKSPAECTNDNQCLLGHICTGERCIPGCRSSGNCPGEQACIKNKCLNACAISGACGRGATCTPANHVAVCSCPSGFRGDPDVECREITPECRADEECGLDKICLKNRCIAGCRTHSNCPYDKACVNGFCQSPCDIGGMCGLNTICRPERHEAHCSCSPGYTGDPLKQCTKVFVECDADSDCGGGYVCAHNQCKDINECLKETLPCGPGASCQNLPGWYKCSCPLPLVGNAYGPEGCRPPISLCFHDTDCPNGLKCSPDTQECYEGGNSTRRCDPHGATIGDECIPICVTDHDCSSSKKCHSPSGECYDPCTTKDVDLQCKCGQNAICKTENHDATCYCPPGYEGFPDKVCLPIRECGVTYNCPGNLICLDSRTCGCPPTFYRDNDYCFIKSQNCTTTNPCSLNEECVYTGDQSGFCVCPHGYELLPYGECRAISLCAESNPCAPGAICRDKPGSYECACPVDTIGDPYVKGCKPIVGCTTDHDCPNDRECDTSKQCISPCHICGPNSECTVRDHNAICVCTHGKVGEPYNKQIGCFTPPVEERPEVRTIPPVQDLQVMCLADGVAVSVQLGGYDGIVYVKGHSNDANCRRMVTSNEVDSIDFKVMFGHCGLIHTDGEASFVLVVQKHPRLVTYRARAYHIKCVYATGERTVTLGFNVSMITTSGTIANTGPPPTCLMSICTTDGREISSAEIGDDLVLKVDVQPDFIYGGFARSCVAKTMEDEGEFQYEVTDENGCATDPSIFGNWEYDPHQKQLMARFNAFKFPSSNNLRFQCNIRVCFGSCPPVNCEGVDAYGRRRRRRREIKDEDLLLTDSFKEGALREEIMVQSNAILTFEKRDPQPSAPIEGPRIEDIDHVCLPKLGLILSMIITTLLALVAVAVAISCWLMAYRRRPKRHHQTASSDYSNTMYTTPEPEPIPDYYHPSVMSGHSRQSMMHHRM